MDRKFAHAFASCLLFLLILNAVCFRSRWTVRAAATIIVPDDYSTVQKAINNAADGDTIFVRAGTYLEHVVVNKTVSLVGEDPSTTIVDGNNTGHVVYIIRDNVNVTGFTIQKNGNVQLDAGICLNNSANCFISGNRLIDIGFCGISLLYSQQNTIINNNVTRSNWGGIHLLASSNNTVSRNSVENTYGGINGHVSSNYNNFTENVISNSTHGMFYHASSRNNICRNNLSAISVEGIWLQDQVNYNVVADNTLVNTTVAIRLQGPHYYNILLRNVITDAEYGIKMEEQANSNIASGNIITGCRFGVQVLNARYTEISGNAIAHNYGSDWDAGIRLDYAGHTRICANSITDNWRGILLYTASPYVSVYNNNVTYNEFGIRVSSGGSSYLNISDNIVMNNRGYGIGLTGFTASSNYATLFRNTIVNNSDGIALGQYSDYHTILQNNISMNDIGLYMEYSAHNMIHHNNILNNTQQTFIVASDVNAWDLGYSLGGNYWSDYNGSDVCRGLSQNLTGSDGTGDTPYSIDVNNRDNFPLMGLFGSTITEGEKVTQFPTEDVGLVFENVTNGGLTTVNKTWSGPAHPQGFELLGQYYDIETTADYSGMIQIRIAYNDSGITEAEENALRLMLWNETLQEWINITSNIDAQSDIVFGEATQLSLFGMFIDHTMFIDGDVNYDGVVNMSDIGVCCGAFGSHPGNPRWDQHCDINEDDTVNMRDIGIACTNFGKQYP